PGQQLQPQRGPEDGRRGPGLVTALGHEAPRGAPDSQVGEQGCDRHHAQRERERAELARRELAAEEDREDAGEQPPDELCEQRERRAAPDSLLSHLLDGTPRRPGTVGWVPDISRTLRRR